MSKRPFIWITVVLVAVAAAAVAFRWQQPDEDAPELTHQKASGDFVKFYLERVQKAGGTPAVTNALPKFEAEWEFADNPNGFHVFLPQKWKTELIAHFTTVFGEPRRSSQFPHLSYPEDRFNVAITVNLEADPMPIVCLKHGMQKRKR